MTTHNNQELQNASICTGVHQTILFVLQWLVNLKSLLCVCKNTFSGASLLTTFRSIWLHTFNSFIITLLGCLHCHRFLILIVQNVNNSIAFLWNSCLPSLCKFSVTTVISFPPFVLFSHYAPVWLVSHVLPWVLYMVEMAKNGNEMGFLCKISHFI
jgi:hypothetical protein